MVTALEAAVRLHGYLSRQHWDGQTLGGQDQGVKWHIRIGRFVDSYCPWWRKPDRYVFQQGQGYWVLANWLLADLTGNARYEEVALAATQATAALQLDDGSWPYPLPERKHLKATIEGNWGALVLLRGYERTGNQRWAEQALRWHRFLMERIGFLDHHGGRAVNYFDQPRGKVPNNSVSLLWFLGEYHRVLGSTRSDGGNEFLEPVADLLTFLESVQAPSGEFPYELPSPHDQHFRPHYLCYQYNAFACIRLIWFGEYAKERRALKMAERAAGFLAGGMLESGASKANCFRVKPEVVHYADVLALALYEAHRQGWGNYADLVRRGFAWVLRQQGQDGGMVFSRGDYGCLTDRNSYPRYLAMTLYHLLLWDRHEQHAPVLSTVGV